MSRPVSLTFKQAVNAPETSEAFLILITIDHPDLSSPIRVTSDAKDTTSRSNLFVAFPFELTLPSDSENGPPRASLRIDNVDRQIVQAIRTISSAPSVLMEIVLGSDPDTVEAAFPGFQLNRANYDVLVVSGELTMEQFLTEPYPAAGFFPANFQGLF